MVRSKEANKIKAIIKQIPHAPGVYLMKDKAGEIIYVGKAKSLRKRLNTYLSHTADPKTRILLSHVRDIAYRLCPTESLALLLEARLIREYRPRYNISLRDDKSYPMVKFTNEVYPAVCITRKREQDGARYFGPFTSVYLLREALRIIRRYFPYRSCKRMPREACMYYRLGLSPGACIRTISRKKYAETIENIALLLEGKTERLIARLSRAMQVKARQHKFEEAARLRDQIEAVSSLGRSAVSGRSDELKDLQELLKMKTQPQRIEAFDISNMYGKEATGSMVSFYKGVADKDNYRRFRVKTVNEINDYSMLCEVIHRRYAKLIDEGLPLPDLVIIDGGRGHLHAAKNVLDELGVGAAVISIAKEKENIYQPGRALPLDTGQRTAALNLVRRIRDEAHRFAISYHHVLRRKKMIGR